MSPPPRWTPLICPSCGRRAIQEGMACLPEELVRFSGDALTLEGRLAVPAGATRSAVICHPHPQYGGDMDNNVVVAVAAALSSAGVATLRFNFRGVGASEGRYEGGGGESRDVRAAVNFLRGRLPGGQVVLVGYSFGAVVALLAEQGAAADEVRLVAIAPPVSMFDIGSLLSECSKPKLFIAGERDPFCPPAALEQVLTRSPGPMTMVRVASADHFFFGHEAVVADAVSRFVAAE